MPGNCALLCGMAVRCCVVWLCAAVWYDCALLRGMAVSCCIVRMNVACIARVAVRC